MRIDSGVQSQFITFLISFDTRTIKKKEKEEQAKLAFTLFFQLPRLFFLNHLYVLSEVLQIYSQFRESDLSFTLI